MWKIDDKVMSDFEIILMLDSTHSGVVVIDGPSGCGKTTIVRSINKASKVIASSELVSLCIEKMKGNSLCLETMIKKKLDGYDAVCLEDIDMMLSGKKATTEMIQRIIKELTSNSLIVATGIDIDKRVPGFAETIGAKQYRYCE